MQIDNVTDNNDAAGEFNIMKIWLDMSICVT